MRVTAADAGPQRRSPQPPHLPAAGESVSNTRLSWPATIKAIVPYTVPQLGDLLRLRDLRWLDHMAPGPGAPYAQ